MRYAKLIDNQLQIAPNPIHHGTYNIWNPPDFVYEAEGYLPMVYTDMPEAPSGKVAVSHWEEQSGQIVQVWSFVDAPDEVGAEEALEILFGGEGE